MVESIKFYSEKNEYGEFSNFSPHPIDLDGQRWPTTEHYFQAMKFRDPEVRTLVRKAKGPMAAAKLGRTLPDLRRDWEHVKENFMMNALRAKFAQHDRLRRLLLDTGDAQLIEHTRNDHYWADGGDGSGKNRLGVLLMKLRSELHEAGDETDGC